MPAHRGGSEENPIRWRKHLAEAEERLVKAGCRAAEVKELLAPARRLLEDVAFWKNQSDGLAVFLAPQFLRLFRLPLAFQDRVIVANRFSIIPLLPLLTGNSITLIGSDGKKNVLLRGDLDELSSSGKSAMPEGLEKEIKPQDLADLIAHIRSQGPQPKRKVFAGNKPELVRPAGDGSLLLSAANCEIYGPTVVLEKKYGNLGYWSSTDDRAVWAVEVAKPGRYAVWLDWACHPDMAGKKFLLQAGVNQMTGKVESTGKLG